MTRRPETDATKGSCALPLAKRVVSVVDTRTRRSDPFAARPSVGITLGNMRSKDDNTSVSQAIHIAINQGEIIELPRPGSGRPCLTVRDARRIAAAHTRYVEAGERQNARACRERLETGLPQILDRAYVTGP